MPRFGALSSTHLTRVTACACKVVSHFLRVFTDLRSPILTYGKQGTTKPGLHPEHHGMIYNGESAPPLLPNEKPLAIPAVRMILQSGRKVEHLDPASRVNYAKIYTVEHNVKCVIIGSIDEGYRDIIRAQHKNFHKT